jgi:hypothetical protein
MEIEKKKRTVYMDGWHSHGDGFQFLVEDGRLMRGVDLDKGVAVYPYKSDGKGLYSVSGIKARYSVLRNIYWR